MVIDVGEEGVVGFTVTFSTKLQVSNFVEASLTLVACLLLVNLVTVSFRHRKKFLRCASNVQCRMLKRAAVTSTVSLIGENVLSIVQKVLQNEK